MTLQLFWIKSKQIMDRSLYTIMEVPTEDQIFDNVSFKLGAFHKLFWVDNLNGFKQDQRKAGELILLAQKMKQIPREDDRLIKICAYSRQLMKFQAANYAKFKDKIWADLKEQDRLLMEKYVEELTPPTPNKGESRKSYDPRQKNRMFDAYGKMKKGMLILEVLEKIWTIRKYEDVGNWDDKKRHQTLAKQIFDEMNRKHPNFRKFMEENLGKDEWNKIEHLWKQ